MKEPQEILSQMSLEEKAALCDGKDFWHLKGLEKYGIPEIMVCDGPHGLRKKDYEKVGVSISTSVPAICFPPAATTACSWDPDLLFEMGTALGKKCQKENVGVLLGPGINMKRSPLCGRNFEYFSEDPVLAGKMAAGMINGVQSVGVGTSLKHFCCNSQETRRMVVDEVVDERALREIYMRGFEIAVKESQPWTVMSSYNQINGSHGSENSHTLTEILRDEWGFEGTVVSDWGAVNDRVKGLKAGNDIEMPSSSGSGAKKIVEAVKNGSLDEKTLDESVLRILELIKKCSDNEKPNFEYNDLDDQALARKIASSSMVLMKNDGILPIKKGKKYAVIGALAKKPRYQGAGSSHIVPTQLDNAYDELSKLGFNLCYAQGYELSKRKAFKNDALIEEARKLAEKVDTVLLFVGLTDEYEAEGYDRENMDLPAAHNKLVEEIAKVNKNIVVVLAGGSPVALPWNGKVKAILNSYLGGQAGGGAVADILSGKVNPSGKLAETYPVSYDDTPARYNFPGNPATVEHRESIYIGYRYYEKAGKKVRYPFGYGLSYTEFEYSDLKISKKKISENEELTVTFKVKNTGEVAGAETAQLYVADNESTVFRPVKELKAFKKVFLEPGEEKEISFILGKRDFAFWNVKADGWTVESGSFDIIIGASSADVRLTAAVKVNAEASDIPDYKETAPLYYEGDVQEIPDEQFREILGREIPAPEKPRNRKIDLTDNFESSKHTKNGARAYKTVSSLIPDGFARGLALQTPFRDFISMSGGVFNEEMAEGLLLFLNDEKGGFKEIMSQLPNAVKGIVPLIRSI